ncbi:hypothetical protein [Ensifer aridi]|uniref:hypothetical protein n=1 Tax=Ensifer aridi TaxID=1708715 RepID=UPI0011117273|nr:hypothetical protein [Ensifer aridi]
MYYARTVAEKRISRLCLAFAAPVGVQRGRLAQSPAVQLADSRSYGPNDAPPSAIANRQAAKGSAGGKNLLGGSHGLAYASLVADVDVEHARDQYRQRAYDRIQDQVDRLGSHAVQYECHETVLASPIPCQYQLNGDNAFGVRDLNDTSRVHARRPHKMRRGAWVGTRRRARTRLIQYKKFT